MHICIFAKTSLGRKQLLVGKSYSSNYGCLLMQTYLDILFVINSHSSVASESQAKKELYDVCDFLNLLMNNNHISIKSSRSELKSLRDIESPFKR